MQSGSFEKLSGEVEADETFVGGLEKFKHQDRKLNAGRGTVGKAVVWGALQREGRIICTVVDNTKARTLQSELFKHVAYGANLYTDAHLAYQGVDGYFQHQFVDHAIAYVEGQVHTNSLENFWSLLKRSIKGTYVSVEPYHLSRYLDEQVFRCNERKGKDADRFALALSQVAGRRITYNELIGKLQSAAGA